MLKISPLVFLALSLILGIIWQATGSTPWLVLVFMGILTTFFFGYKQNQKLLLFLTLAICFFITGALRYTHQKHHFESCISAITNKSCSITGTIEDIEPSYRKQGQTLMIISLKEMRHYNEIIPQAAGLNLKIATQQKTDHLRAGDTVTCSKIFLRESTNEDYTRYLIKEDIMGHVVTKQTIICLQRPQISITRWFIEKRNDLIEKAQKKLSPVTFTLFSSIFWGKKELNQRYMEPIKDQFKIWGIVHYLARSGLHVILFIILWNWIFMFLPIRFGLKQVFLASIIIGYYMLSWPSVSFIRSIISFIFYKICLFNDLQINILHILSLTCILVLIINPFQLFFLDFQLSFGLTFALAWLSELQK